LLTTGQPARNAGIATLERHIEFLRELIVRAGLPLVEVPPAPQGHRFTVVLTHDLDHPSIRLHRLDHTVIGFLYRAVIGSLLRLWRGRSGLGTLWRNWMAVLRLPLIHLGLATDIWRQLDRYLDIERGLGSTFFVIPVKGYPGRSPNGQAPRRRASAYGAA